MRKLFSRVMLPALLCWLTLHPALAQKRPDAEAMGQAMALFYQGDWDGAIEAFASVLEDDPQNTLAASYQLDAYFRKTEIDVAINRAERLVVNRGEDPVAQSYLALAYFLRDKTRETSMEDALTEAREALKADPNLPIANCVMGMIYFEKRNMPRAQGYFRRCLRYNPYDVMALELMANIMTLDYQLVEESYPLYERVVRLLPTYPDGHFYMGRLLYRLGRYQEAIGYFKKAAELDPHGYTKGYDARVQLGNTYCLLDMQPEAIAAWEEALKVRPDSKEPRTRIEMVRHGEKPKDLLPPQEAEGQPAPEPSAAP